MDEHANPNRFDEHTRRRGRRFLAIFAAIVAVFAIFVASVNLVAYRYMLRDRNQDIVQLLAGWGRMYKPILYDEIEPQVAVFGASWARDAFDPIETGRLLGKTVFNHGVSGGTPYEVRRFADASLDNPNLESAIVNLDTFYRGGLDARTRYGFDESILDLDPQRRPRRWVGLKRTYALALTGWAAGANLKLIEAILQRDRGVPRAKYLRAYQQANHTRRQGRMDMARRKIFPEPGSVSGEDQAAQTAAEPIATSPELDWLVDGFCSNGIDVYAYFTPSSMREADCELSAREASAALDFFRRKQHGCASTIHLFDFAYPNAVTLEGVLTPVRRSLYYRPDGHPRPTVGLLMAARMFAREFPAGTPAVLSEDFGVDLLSDDDPEGWLRERGARCTGDWGRDGYDAFVRAMTASGSE